jgi:hypothetical protein
MKKLLIILCAFLLIGCKEKEVVPIEEPIVIEIDEEVYHNTKLKTYNNSIPHIYRNYIEMDDDVYGSFLIEMIDSNFEPVWSYEWRDLVIEREDHDIEPVIYEDMVIVNVQGVISVHSLLTGEFKWELETTQTDAKFAIDEGLLYVLGYKDNFISAVSLETGEMLLEIKDDRYLDVNALSVMDEIIAYFDTKEITINAVSFNKDGSFIKRLAYQDRSKADDPWGLATSSDESETVSNVIDENAKTYWHEMVKGYGEKEWIEITRAFPIVVKELHIMNGNQASEKEFLDNAKLKTVSLSVGDGKSFTYSFTHFEYGYTDVIKFVQPIMADYIIMTIMEAEPGDMYKNTSISEIRTK